MAGRSTGARGYDKVKYQHRKLQSLLQSFYGDFSSDNMDPTLSKLHCERSVKNVKLD